MARFLSISLALLFVILPTALFAQAQIVTIEYYSGGNITVDTVTSGILDSGSLYDQMQVKTGWRISTGKDGAVELKMKPNGTIIKLAANTVFTVKSLDTGSGLNRQNEFQLLSGKFRAVATKVTGIGNSENYYRFTSNSAVCGVRGTDFGMDETGGNSIAFTINGLVWFQNKAGDIIEIGAGQMANALAGAFQPSAIPADYLKMIDDSLKFLKAANDSAGTTILSPEPTATPTPGANDGNVTQPNLNGTAEPTPDSGSPKPTLDPWLQKLLNMEIGSVIIGDVTYGKVVAAPEIDLGALKMGLYLPIIYQKDMFNPAMWYRPDGNNEWSFGTDSGYGEDYLARSLDFFSDLFLKIKYFQWGNQGDPFMFKIGSLKTFTIGHGLLMNNYANDADFPAIRRIGINLAVNTPQFGFEIMTNDFNDVLRLDPRILGTRLVFRPFAPGFGLGIGISGVADFNPGKDLPDVTTGGMHPNSEIGNPMFINLGIDLDWPILPNPFSITAFADLGALLPYFRTDGTGAYTNIKAGPAVAAIFTGDTQSPLRNYGISAGIMGKLFVLDYKLDYRFFNGTFKSAFFGRAYDRTSAETAMAVANYVQNPNDPVYDRNLMGIYFEAGYTWEKMFSISAGYMQPLMVSAGQITLDGEDAFMLKAGLEKNALPPIVPVYGSISYERTYFIPFLMNQKPTGKTLSFWDEYAVLRGEIVYGVSPNLDMVLLLTNAIAKDANGSVVYDVSGNPKMDITFSVETRIHF